MPINLPSYLVYCTSKNFSSYSNSFCTARVREKGEKKGPKVSYTEDERRLCSSAHVLALPLMKYSRLTFSLSLLFAAGRSSPTLAQRLLTRGPRTTSTFAPHRRCWWRRRRNVGNANSTVQRVTSDDGGTNNDNGDDNKRDEPPARGTKTDI